MHLQAGSTGPDFKGGSVPFKKLVILVDMDGVMCDWFKQALTEIQAVAKDMDLGDISESIFTEWKMEKTLVKYYPSLVEAFVALTRAPGFYANLTPIEGAVEAIKAMAAAGHEVFFCSSPEDESQGHCCHTEKAQWIDKHLGQEWVKKLILTKDKTLVRGDVLIDDKDDIKGVMEPVWEHLKFKSPLDHRDHPGFNWARIPYEISRIICELLEEQHLQERDNDREYH